MDSSREELYCQLFVEGGSRQELFGELLAFLGGRAEMNTIEAPNMELYVDRNDERCDKKAQDPIRGFLFYPYTVDVDPTAETGADEYIEAVAGLVEELRRRGYRVVAASEFEDRLPIDSDRERARRSFSDRDERADVTARKNDAN